MQDQITHHIVMYEFRANELGQFTVQGSSHGPSAQGLLDGKAIVRDHIVPILDASNTETSRM
jgi:hypothetical protein